MLGAVLVAAFLASRSCASTPSDVSKEEAIGIARAQVAFEPDNVQVRFMRQGLPQSRAYWLVSLSTEDENGRPTRIRTFRVDAQTGRIAP